MQQTDPDPRSRNASKIGKRKFKFGAMGLNQLGEAKVTHHFD